MPPNEVEIPEDSPRKATRRDWWQKLADRIEEFFFGAAMSWVTVPYMMKRRREMEMLFSVLASMRLLGLPLLPGIDEIHLIPFMLPNLLYWRRMTIFSDELQGVDLKHIGH